MAKSLINNILCITSLVLFCTINKSSLQRLRISKEMDWMDHNKRKEQHKRERNKTIKLKLSQLFVDIFELPKKFPRTINAKLKATSTYKGLGA